MDDRECEVRRARKRTTERVKKIAKAARYAYRQGRQAAAQGKACTTSATACSRLSWINSIPIRPSSPTARTYRDWNGAFAVYRGLTEALPYHRLFNAPISESAIVGTAVGYGMAGGRVIVELMYCDFIGLLGRRGLQPDGQMAGHERRRAQDAGGSARAGRLQVRRSALSGLDCALRSRARPEGGTSPSPRTTPRA